MINCETIDNCIACGSSDLLPVFDLGIQPLANSYKNSPDESEPMFPLAIVSCKHCSHVQLTHLVDPSLLFKDYAYMSGVTKTQLDFFKWFSELSTNYVEAKSALDIGCNDGSMLDFLKAMGMETWGVDPAENLYPISSKNHNVICDFFESTLLEDKKFDLVTVMNAFAHNYNQLELLNNISECLNDDGILMVTTSQADMLLNGEFDTIYHEHLSFYNIKSMNELCKRANLNLIDVVRHPIHGSSYIFIISKTKSNPQYIKSLMLEEEKLGLYGQEILENFKNTAEERVNKVKKLFELCEEKGVPVVGYGAPAKSSTFLNCAGVKPAFIVEDTPLKQDKYTPGLSVPMLNQNDSFEILENYEQICFIILAWNFYPEIKNKILEHRPDCKDLFFKYFPNIDVE